MSHSRPRWEYKILAHLAPDKLDRLGDDGWEMVVVVKGGPMGEMAYFKRMKDEPVDPTA